MSTQDTPTLYIQEVYENATTETIFGESEPYEPWTQEIGRLFRALQREYGRCTGNVYVDRKDESTVKIGWIFEKRMQYEDARTKDDTYIRKVWVTFYTQSEDGLFDYYPLKGKV